MVVSRGRKEEGEGQGDRKGGSVRKRMRGWGRRWRRRGLGSEKLIVAAELHASDGGRE